MRIKPDWTKAPEEATHWGASDDEWNAAWMYEDCGIWYGMLDDGKDDRWDILPAASRDKDRIDSLEPRP